MKALKISLITFGSLFVIVYLAFLLAIPAFVKLEDYNYELNFKRWKGIINFEREPSFRY